MLVTASPGGGPKQVYDLVRHLPSGEIEVVVAAPRDGLFFDRFRGVAAAVEELPLSRLGARHLLRAVRLIRAHRIDVVHTHGKGPGLYGRLAARWLGVPAVHTLHGIHYSSYPPASRALYFALERRLSALSHAVINLSQAQEAEGLALGLFTRQHSVVVVNGIDVDEVDRTGRRSPARRAALGLEPGHVVIGCVSRWDRVKRFETLLEAVALLARDLPQIALVLVGGGAEENRIRRLVADARLADRVVFTGFLANPLPIYGVLDLYAASSLKEGLPLAPLEAMAAGLPVVATDAPGHREVVVDGATGLLVPAEDGRALARAIAALAADPERRRTMGAAGRQRVRQHFAIRAMVERTADVYRRAARSAGVARRAGGPSARRDGAGAA
jgi:glycosyltransferase involved in cell wall biosynthesis